MIAACGGGPASDGSQCTSPCADTCPKDEVCVSGFPDGGSYCLRSCKADGDCSDGFVCGQMPDGTGVCWVEIGSTGAGVDCRAAGCIETMNDAQTLANDCAGQRGATQLWRMIMQTILYKSLLWLIAIGSALMLASVIIGCGGGDDFGSGQGYVPAALMGKWSSSSVSGVSYGDGTTSSPSGTIAQFTFLDGGRYIFELYDMASSYSCSTTIYGRETGTAQFADATFTLAPAAANLTSKSSCSAEWNYQRAWSERDSFPKDYQWSVQPDPYLAVSDLVVVTGLGQTWPLRPQ